MYYVTVYLIEREIDDDGEYRNIKTIISSIYNKQFSNQKDAGEYMKKYSLEIEEINRGRSPLCVIGNKGVFQLILENHPPRNTPKILPYT